MIRQHGSKQTDVFAPVVAFNTPDGRPWKVRSPEAYYPPAYKVGDRIAVVYGPAQPATAAIDTMWGVWGKALISGIAGVVFLAIGSLIVFRRMSTVQP
jgi:hypothetical protein